MSYLEKPDIHHIQPKQAPDTADAHHTTTVHAEKRNSHPEQTKNWDDMLALYDILRMKTESGETGPNQLSYVVSATLRKKLRDTEAHRQHHRFRKKPVKHGKTSTLLNHDDIPPSVFKAKEDIKFANTHKLPAEFNPLSIWPESDGGITLLGGGMGILVNYGPDGDSRWQVLLNQKKYSDAHHIIGSHISDGKTILFSQSRQTALYSQTGELLDRKQLDCASLTGGFYEPIYEQYHVQDWVLYQSRIYDKNWNFIQYYELPTGMRSKEKLARIALDIKNQRVLAVFSGPRETGENPFLLASYDLNGNFIRFLGLPVIAGVTPYIGIAPTNGLILLASKRNPLISLDNEGNLLPGSQLPTPYSFCLTGKNVYLIDHLDFKIRCYKWHSSGCHEATL